MPERDPFRILWWMAGFRIFISLLVLSLISGCFDYKGIRLYYSKGEDREQYVGRIVIPPTVSIILVDGLYVPNGVNLETFAARGNRVINLLPGEHELGYLIQTKRLKFSNTKAVKFEVKAGDVIFLCHRFTVDYAKNPDEWEPWIWKPDPSLYGSENIIRLNYFLDSYSDRHKCFSHSLW